MAGICGRDEPAEIVGMHAPLPLRARHRAAGEVNAEGTQPSVVDLKLVGRHLPVPDGRLRKLHGRPEFDR
jgi:hypothetical protein